MDDGKYHKITSLVVCLIPILSWQAQANERVALVMGNAAYKHAPPLANPRNDAEDMAALLRQLGFQVTAGLDLTDAAMEDQVRAFSRQARAANVALFFYAGHGMQVDGVNYLVPVDAQLADEADLPFETVELDLVMKRMGGGTNLVFLDACRDNPFARSWMGAGRSASVGRGLTRVGEASGSGLFIAFATDPDRIAADGEGRNSPFTAALKRHIETPGLEINALLTEVRKTVLTSTGNVQRPWSNSSLSDAFYFVPGTASPANRTGASRLNVDAAPVLQETVFWESVKDSSDASAFEAYLAKYPSGAFAPLAANRLRALWTSIENRSDPMAFEDYLAANPSGRFVGDARARLQVWVQQADESALQRYLGEYPKGAVADAAAGRLSIIAWEAAKDSSSPDELDRLAKRHPGTEAARLAALRRDELLKVRAAIQAKWPAGKRFRDCVWCPELIVVPSGTFRMGSPELEKRRSPSEGPMHSVSIASFAIGVYEVTFAEWEACIAGDGCGGYRPDDEDWGRDRHPVINVSWHDVQLYVQWLSDRTGHQYRLPSESEWEYAARAGTTGPYHTGATISADRANYNGRYSYPLDNFPVSGSLFRKRTVPVGSFGANAFGLHDVHGNVWEWVADCWNNTYAGAPGDGSAWEYGDCSLRVLRGGSWSSEPRYLRSAYRYRRGTGGRNGISGFRVARTLTP